jgi:hypothetical protein
MQRASSHFVEHHLGALLIVQINAGLKAAKGLRYLIHYAVEELIEIENRCNSLRGFLHPLQIFYKVGG